MTFTRGQVTELTVQEVKRALADVAMRKRKRPPAGTYVQVEITWCQEADRIVGAKVWFTKEIELGQDPELAVVSWR